MVDFRCDLDLCITVQPVLLKIPTEDLIRHMKEMLLKVKPSIKLQGRENAKLSEPFLAKRPEETEHILNHWARTVVVPEQTRKENEYPLLWGDTREEEDASLDMFNPWADSNVKGRLSEMMLMEDGTLAPLEHTSTSVQPRSESHVRDLNIDDGWDFQQSMPPVRPVVRSNFPDRARQFASSVRTTPEIQRLSESNVNELDPLDKPDVQHTIPPVQPIPSSVRENAKPPPAEDDFDWLFGDEPSESSKREDESNEKAK
jgi:hypothetical protein